MPTTGLLSSPARHGKRKPRNAESPVPTVCRSWMMMSESPVRRELHVPAELLFLRTSVPDMRELGVSCGERFASAIGTLVKAILPAPKHTAQEQNCAPPGFPVRAMQQAARCGRPAAHLNGQSLASLKRLRQGCACGYLARRLPLWACAASSRGNSLAVSARPVHSTADR